MSELAAQASLTPSGLTRSVDRLQEQGLVARRVCPEDRRGAFAVLTPEGQELMDRAIPEHLAHIDEMLSSLFTADEEATLSLLLRRLRDHLFEVGGDCALVQDDGGPCPSADD
jgi:DNA-binding MarR family transcriptional regulator